MHELSFPPSNSRSLLSKLFKFYSILAFLFLLTPSTNLYANSLADLKNEKTYKLLLGDIYPEIQQWFHTDRDILEATELWNQLVSGQVLNSRSMALFKDIWPPKKINYSGNFRDQFSGFQGFKDPNISSGLDHAIADIRTYVDNRIGPAAVKLFAQGSLSIKVVATTDVAIEPKEDVYELPSLYSRRGIRKYYAPATKTLIINIPPITEFAQHYYAMLATVRSSNFSVKLDPNNRERYRQDLKGAVKTLWGKLKAKGAHGVLGGAAAWLERSLKSQDSVWEVISKEQVEDQKFGIVLEKFNLRHKSTKTITSLVSLKSSTYRWGEASVHLSEGMLEAGAKSIFFLNTAGAPGRTAQPYDLSVPGGFFIDDQKVPISNIIEDVFKRKNENYNKVEPIDQSLKFLRSSFNGNIHFGFNHAYSYSPAQQTIAFAAELAKKGYETVEVEQNLIAKAVSKFNKRTHSNIPYGVLDLITDKPRTSIDFKPHAQDLDNIDKNRRSTSVATGLQMLGLTISSLEHANMSQCKFLSLKSSL